MAPVIRQAKEVRELQLFLLRGLEQVNSEQMI
jgi:hypothetical protein